MCRMGRPDQEQTEAEIRAQGLMVDREATNQRQIQLLRRIAAEDRAAVAEFYDEIAGVLFSTAVRILGNTHDAEEILQDVFVQVWKKAGEFNPERGTPIHWVLSITRNRCIDQIRSRQRRTKLVEDMYEEAAITSTAFGLPPEDMLTGGQLTAIHAAMKELPEDQRTAIELAFFRGLSHSEIAERVREPLGTIKARIRRGMLKLRDQLKPFA